MSLLAETEQANYPTPTRGAVKPSRRCQIGLVAVLVVYAFATRVLVAATLPPWQAPDEPKHFEYVRVLVDRRDELWAERRLPTLDDAIPAVQREVIASMVRFHFWDFLGAVPTPASNALPSNFQEVFGPAWTMLHRPSLYYDITALMILPLQGASLESQLAAMRVVSALVSALAVLPAYAIGRLIAPRDQFVPIAAAALAAMLPMAIFIGGAVSVDNLLLVWGMFAVLGMSRGVVIGFTWRTWLLILSSVTLGLLTKRGAVILLPGVLVSGVIWLTRLHWPTRGWVLGSLVVGAAAVAAVLITGYLARVPLVQAALSILVAYSLNDPGQFGRVFQAPIDSVQTWQIVAVELDAYFRSFWGIFGWFNVFLAPWVYSALLITTGFCVLGCGSWLFGLGPAQKHRLALFVVLLALITSALVAGVAERLAEYSVSMVPQGRYMFVVLGAIGVLYALGARSLLRASRFGTTLPTVVFVGSLVTLDVYSYAGAILPFFSRSFP